MEESILKHLRTGLKSNIRIFWDHHPVMLVAISFLAFIIVNLSVVAVWLIANNSPSQARTFADIGSAFATIMLAALTGIYVISTKQLVRENKRTREHREEMYKQEKEDKREHLRQAFKSELEQNDYMGQLPKDWENMGYTPPESKIPEDQIPPAEHIPTRVFDAHIDDLGVLDEEEASKILEYYHIIVYLKKVTNEIREEKTDSMNAYEALFGLMKKYDTMRPQLIEMLDGERDPHDVEVESVISTLEGQIMTESERHDS